MKFQKKPVVIEATQWFENGDHPDDECVPIIGEDGQPFRSEGKGVRYYRRPECDGQKPCSVCDEIMHVHGWIDSVVGGYIVCPGNWIITGIAGELYPCKDSIFRETYEDAEEKEKKVSEQIDKLKERIEASSRFAGSDIANEISIMEALVVLLERPEAQTTAEIAAQSEYAAKRASIAPSVPPTPVRPAPADPETGVDEKIKPETIGEMMERYSREYDAQHPPKDNETPSPVPASIDLRNLVTDALNAGWDKPHGWEEAVKRWLKTHK